MSKKLKSKAKTVNQNESLFEEHLSPFDSFKKWLWKTFPKSTKLIFLMYGLYLVLENGFNFLQKYKQFPLISSFYSDYSLYINPIDFSRDKDGNCKLSYEIINDGNQTIKIISHYIVREYINTTERTATKIIDIESIGPTYSAPVQKTFPLGYWHPFTDSKIVDSLQKINEALAIYLVSDSITIVIKKDTLSIKNQIGKGIIYDESNIQVFPITKSKILIYD